MEAWAPTVDQLLTQWTAKKNLRILTFDNRGVGGTDAPWGRYTTSQMAQDILGLMDHLNWDNAHIVGISMGGMIALEMSYVNDHGNGDMIRSLLARDPKVIVNSILTMLYPSEFLSKKMADQDLSVRQALYNVHEHRLKTTTPPPFSGIIGHVFAVKTHFLSNDRLAAIADAGFPVLILGAGKDRVIPGRESATLARLIQGDHVRLTMYDDAGHGMFIQYLDEVIQDLLRNFMRAAL
ncbi:hypothetical protein P43SY_006598 [Pythium insidiosum]|uniref:AB hydrolase-1 domain-containing protein n=1 Tax=Pythium insidiosum TaxID=114742 RepID=A0AAD5Q4S1_PYTIN|nr:hypothetical protein P43SY_006598 [Pythium insidiosum]